MAINIFMYFYKLNKKVNAGSFSEDRLINAYAINGKGISFYDVNGYDKDKLLSLIPERYRQDFFVREMKINYNIPPHTDSYVLATINFYIKTSNCETKFFEHLDAAHGVQMTTQTTGRTFKEEQLTFAGSFIAESDDVYILDVTKPHGVKSLDTNPVDRIVLVLQSKKYTFEETCAMLQETGYLDGP